MASDSLYQLQLKQIFVKKYCDPDKGWSVHIDIDASEEGKTGSERVTPDAILRQKEMGKTGVDLRNAYDEKVFNRQHWLSQLAKPKRR